MDLDKPDFSLDITSSASHATLTGGREMHRYIIVDLADDLGEGDHEKVLSAVRMTRGIKSADWCQSHDGAYYGAYHRCRRAYAKAIRDALALADAELIGPDAGVILPPRRPRFDE
jgi:hypothetical protein